MSASITQPAGPSQIFYTVGVPQQVFPLNFQFDDQLDLQVFVGGVDILQAFSLTGTTQLDGIFTAGSVLLPAPVAATTVLINRATRIQQNTSFPTSGAFIVRMLNAEIARTWQALQDNFRRSTHVMRPPDNELLIPPIPSASLRASRLLGFDAAGAPIAVAAVGNVVISPYMETVLDDTTAALARVTLGVPVISSYMETVLNDTTAAEARVTLGLPVISEFAGFRNLIINGNPIINQRGYVTGAATTSANQYTLDRWRVVVSGQSVTFTDSLGVRTVTAPAGGMEQVIEGASILGGVHRLSWVGTATATVDSAAVANGGQVTLVGGANVTVRLSGGTASLIQLEPGTQVTPFERRPFATEMGLCDRYFQLIRQAGGFTAGAAEHIVAVPIPFRANMRAAPAASAASTVVTSNVSGPPLFEEVSSNGARYTVFSVTSGHCVLVQDIHLNAEL